MTKWDSYGSYEDIEQAKQAIKNHQAEAIKQQNAKYKKSAIHYVE